MKKLSIILLVFIFLSSTACEAVGFKKNFKERFINQALNAEKRKNHKSAFFNFEKLMFYYPNDETSLKAYAQFCERNKYYPKAIEIYKKLFKITNKKEYYSKIVVLKALNIPKKQAPKVPVIATSKPPTTIYERHKPYKTKVKTKKTPKSNINKNKPQQTERSKEDIMYEEVKNKNWERAKSLISELLITFPNNPQYIRLLSDIALEQKDFANAIKYLEMQPNLKEQDYINLTYCYYELKDYDGAISVADRILTKKPESEKWLKYKGDLQSMKKDFKSASKTYTDLIKINPKPEYIIKQTDFFLAQNKYPEAEDTIAQLYNSGNRTKECTEKYLHILYTRNKIEEAYSIARENNLLNTPTGMLLDADRAISLKDYNKARAIYEELGVTSSYDKLAQMGIANSYIATGSDIRSIEELKKCPECNDTKYLTAKAYYNLEMYEEAYNILRTLPQNEEVITFENKIKRDRAYLSSIRYELYTQKLKEEYKLDANKIAFRNSYYEKNMQIYLDYILYVYTSGKLQGQTAQNNVTNEIRLGTQGRINEHWAAKGDIGVKVFQDYGAMILTDSWLQYFLNDNVNFKLGFRRNNIEQSYLSAVGARTANNVFIGQVADNNVYLDTTIRLPKQYYAFTKGGLGIMTGRNLPSDIYWEGMGGLGKLLRYDLEKPYIQKISLDLVSYNSGYQRNLLNIYDSKGNLYGGFFSPEWFSSNTLNLNLTGRYKNTKLTYGVGGYGGWQYAYKPYQSSFIWGANATISYRINDYIDLNAQYRYYNYADVQRNQFVFNILIRGFKHVKKA